VQRFRVDDPRLFGVDERAEAEARVFVLHVDTTMALAPIAARYVGADPAAITNAQLLRHQDRILFGSDFPLIPYPYEEERPWAIDRGLPETVRRKIFHDNAVAFLAPADANAS